MNKNRVTLELKKIIDKANGVLSTGQNRQKMTAYLYVIFSLFALSFFGLFAIGPTITTITNLNRQYEEGSEALKQLQDKNSALTSLSAEYLNIQPDLELIDNAIPEKPKVAELTRQLELLTIKNNLSVQKLDTGVMEIFPAKNATTPIFSFSFTINVFGEEQDINNFVGDVINMGRIIGIDKLTTGKQNDVFSASITGKAFYYKE